jgi:propionate catabolism operon transcriptional regulator
MNETFSETPASSDTDGEATGFHDRDRGLSRLCVLGYRQLNDLVEAVRSEFGSRAELQLVDVRSDSVVNEARARERVGRVDAFVSAGANAAILRGAVVTPVAAIEVTGYDLMQALLRASEISPRIGVVTYGSTIAELEAIQGVLSVGVEQRCYQSHDEAWLAVRELGAAGCRVFVGPSVVVELAEHNGYRGVLAYSLRSVRRGIESALGLVEASRQSSDRHQHMRGVLNGLPDPVLAIDESGRVMTMNEAMEALIGPLQGFQGRPLATVAPGLSHRGMLGPERDLGEFLLPHRRKPLRARSQPIVERGRTVGALLTLKERAYQRAQPPGASTRSATERARARHRFDDLLGTSPALMRVKELARHYARTDSTILLAGETGTGKELFAQAIHNEGPKSDGPFVAVNCGAFPESLLESLLFGYEDGAFTGGRRGGQRGLVEAAHGGTLFLDEIGDMPLTLQSRLLRVLQEREVVRLGSTTPVDIDVRVVAATHHDLEALVADRRFRADLHYRLNVLHLALPPLRERAEDVEAIARSATATALVRLGSPIDATRALRPLMARMRRYAWPGNVRELENVCERLAVHFAQHASVAEIDYRRIEAECGAPLGRPGRAKTGTAREPQKLRSALDACRGNRVETARRLGVSRSTLWRRMKSLKSSG